MTYRYETRVRYGECDQQGVVFNANYLAYMDEATNVWLATGAPGDTYLSLDWDYMLVRSVVEWQGPARFGELLAVDVGVARLGSTSFDLGYVGRVGERPVFRARAVCVSVDPQSFEKAPLPDRVRAILGEPVDWDLPR